MVALERLVCAEDSWARAVATCAWAERHAGEGAPVLRPRRVELGLGRNPSAGHAIDLFLAGKVGAGLRG